MSNYGSWNLKQLKEELKKRNAKQSGRKRELIERLEAYDRNDNFGKCDVSGPDYQILTPDESIYKDLHGDQKFTKVSMANIDTYLEQFDKKLEDNAKKLYSERYLLFLRLANENNHYFVRSSCKAEMIKSMAYKVDVVFEEHGVVYEAQCECAAGMGPTAHCKHVCTVLYACHIFSTKGTVRTEETCTQRLMNFNHCKKYFGSPIKSNSLNMPGADEVTNLDFDPRPQQFRNSSSYQEHFRNTCLNMPGISKTPIFQIFTPANARAVAKDHDYLELCPEDNFLNTFNITSITKEEILSVERKTVGQNNNKHWAKERCKRIHSSNFGRICKLTNRTDQAKLAKGLTRATKIRSPAILHGNKYESVAINKYMNETGNDVNKCGIFVSEQRPFLAASPDGIVNDLLLVEVKCPYSARNTKITTETVPYLKLIDGKLYLKECHDYFYQIQGQLFCTGRTACDLVVYTITDMVHIRIQREETFIDEMVEKLSHFFDDYFKESVLDKFFYRDYVGFVE